MGRKYGDFFNHNLNAVICTPNITQGMEGWSLYRRTGVPDNLYPAPGRPANYSNHNVPPFRSPYPDKERNLNNANCAPFDAEVVDNLWGKQMWWDTRTGVH